MGYYSILSSVPFRFSGFVMDPEIYGGNSSHENQSQECFFYPSPYLTQQFYLIVIFGFTVAIISFLENSLLLYIFLTRPRYMKSAFLYLTFMAVLDLLHSVSYSMVMVGRTYLDYSGDLRFMGIWYSYSIPMFAISHVLLCTTSYLLVAASLERYLATCQLKLTFSIKKRTVGITGRSKNSNVSLSFA